MAVAAEQAQRQQHQLTLAMEGWWRRMGWLVVIVGSVVVFSALERRNGLVRRRQLIVQALAPCASALVAAASTGLSLSRS